MSPIIFGRQSTFSFRRQIQIIASHMPRPRVLSPGDSNILAVFAPVAPINLASFFFRDADASFFTRATTSSRYFCTVLSRISHYFTAGNLRREETAASCCFITRSCIGCTYFTELFLTNWASFCSLCRYGCFFSKFWLKVSSTCFLIS